MDGVVSTRVGYAGGEKENPTYYNLGDHSETIEIDYVPSQITLEQLLDIFWKSHNPRVKAPTRQYMSIIFYHNEDQKYIAQKSRKTQETKLGTQIYTEINPVTKFYQAENYHQKFYLQNTPVLMNELRGYYKDFQEFVDSTATARINGYVAGFGTLTQLEREFPLFGLSQKTQEYLKAGVK
ncbi:Methionine sulfoxide reductase A [Natranaerobius thermophilus JW/NM-WN-LF]|uniref:peptide-methionine (S)-S-oxide reductase n=1 Tax=Natranaerobius thermophilus (strain ATCC BAA-1301 / DSM 18059 / JW/NM-WN-LF) TaxID=457570 RepID=B2A7D1_NATTJ|nr:Methionine sulfoxide reductase A [Natranaerobius thermophilus JW/NM-WN-LF]